MNDTNMVESKELAGMEEVILVDEHDNVLGSKLRSELTIQDRWRICGVVIFDGRGNTLIAQRSALKKHDPLHWGPGVAGTLVVGETYEFCVERELEEELGVVDSKLEIIHSGSIDAPNGNKRYCVWFSSVVPAGFVPKLQAEEVADYKWLPIPELIKDIESHPENYLNSTETWLTILRTYQGDK
jgi:isopentenyldiphosphate isomerase